MGLGATFTDVWASQPHNVLIVCYTTTCGRVCALGRDQLAAAGDAGDRSPQHSVELLAPRRVGGRRERGRAPQGAVTRLTLPPPGCDARAVLRRMPRALAAAAVFAACTCDGVAAATPAWKTLEPGLSYARVERAGTKFHLVRADLATHELAVADARRDERKVARVDVLRAEAAALAAVNGTFFDEDRRPLGLVVSAGRELNPLRDVSWWAALVVRAGAARPVAELLTTEQLQNLPAADRLALDFAVQVGPRTVVGGRPIHLKAQTAARTALCVTGAGEIVLLASEGAEVESNELAAFMSADAASGGPACAS